MDDVEDDATRLVSGPPSGPVGAAFFRDGAPDASSVGDVRNAATQRMAWPARDDAARQPGTPPAPPTRGSLRMPQNDDDATRRAADDRATPRSVPEDATVLVPSPQRRGPDTRP